MFWSAAWYLFGLGLHRQGDLKETGTFPGCCLRISWFTGERVLSLRTAAMWPGDAMRPFQINT